MQSGAYNERYAESLTELGDARNVAHGVDVSFDRWEKFLNLVVSKDDIDFGAAAWHLRNICEKKDQDDLRKGGLEEWKNYVKNCLKTEPDRRQSAYQKAFDVLKKGQDSQKPFTDKPVNTRKRISQLLMIRILMKTILSLSSVLIRFRLVHLRQRVNRLTNQFLRLRRQQRRPRLLRLVVMRVLGIVLMVRLICGVIMEGGPVL